MWIGKVKMRDKGGAGDIPPLGSVISQLVMHPEAVDD